jgi:DNA-binding transcriptional regulator GbsR (MarR family)
MAVRSTPRGIKVSPELDELSRQVGAFMQYWGFKAIHGRIWVHLFLSPTPLDAGELIQRLKVSKALMSMSITDLLEHDVIMESGKGTRGKQLFVANPQVTEVIFEVLRKRERQLLAKVASAFQLLDGDHKAASSAMDGVQPERLRELGNMIQSAQEALEAFIAIGEIGMDPDICKQMNKLRPRDA